MSYTNQKAAITPLVVAYSFLNILTFISGRLYPPILALTTKKTSVRKRQLLFGAERAMVKLYWLLVLLSGINGQEFKTAAFKLNSIRWAFHGVNPNNSDIHVTIRGNCGLSPHIFVPTKCQLSDRPFHNLRAPLSGDWRILCCSEIKSDGLKSSKSCETGLVGLLPREN